MSFLKKLLGRREDPPPPPPRDVALLVAPLCKPAVHVMGSPDDTPSYLGGAPLLPAGTAWPSRNSVQLTFLACIDLGMLSRTLPAPWLPSSGRLLFFYDTENQPWGFDPNDRGGWAVIFVPQESLPPSPSSTAQGLPRRCVSFQKIDSHPSWERPEVQALRLSDLEAERLIDLSEAVYGRSPCHQIGGFPRPIQSDSMELECQLASHGVYCGDATGSNSAEATRLRGGADDWRLLLQIDSDDDLGVMWGDAGILYFWIREQDARAGRFESSWVVLQCH